MSDLDVQARRSVSAWLGMVDSSCAGVWSSYSRLSEDLAVWEAMGAWKYLNPGARSSHPAHHHTGGVTAAVQASLQGGTDAAGMALEGAESGNGGSGSTVVHGRDAVRASLNELHADYDIR